MNYTKPEVAVLGEAGCVIEQIPHSKNDTMVFDALVPGTPGPNPAYDLDE